MTDDKRCPTCGQIPGLLRALERWRDDEATRAAGGDASAQIRVEVLTEVLARAGNTTPRWAEGAALTLGED